MVKPVLGTITNIGAKKTLFIIVLVVLVIILEMYKVLRFAEEKLNYTQPTKPTKVCFGTNKKEL